MVHRHFSLPIAVFTTFAGQAIGESAELLAPDFNEELHTAANTGGSRVIGLQVTGNDPEAELAALLPSEHGTKNFCVRTRSSDALYDSENPYKAPDNAAEPVEVPHMEETDHESKLMGLTNDGYGVRVFLSLCDEIKSDTPNAIAAWRNGGLGQNITVYVNSLGADEMGAILRQEGQEGQEAAPVFCTPVQSDVTVAFDLRCDLALMNNEDGSIELIPFKGGKIQRSEKVIFKLP